MVMMVLELCSLSGPTGPTGADSTVAGVPLNFLGPTGSTSLEVWYNYSNRVPLLHITSSGQYSPSFPAFTTPSGVTELTELLNSSVSGATGVIQQLRSL